MYVAVAVYCSVMLVAGGGEYGSRKVNVAGVIVRLTNF
jgi:hypothetical protein